MVDWWLKSYLFTTLSPLPFSTKETGNLNQVIASASLVARVVRWEVVLLVSGMYVVLSPLSKKKKKKEEEKF